MSPSEVISFGCRLNIHESELIRQNAAHLDGAVVFNTCAVTNEAVRQARQAIRRLKRERPDVRIIVTGCAAQTQPQDFAAMPEVDLVLGNAEKLDAQKYDFSGERLKVNDIMSLTETAAHMVSGFSGNTRAFLQIQNGCDHRCTFCIIPYGRGPSRSVGAGAIVDQLRGLVGQGYREAVLTGVDLTAYGADLPGKPTLGNLVRRILKLVPELERLRISSIDSAEVDEELFQAFAEEHRLMPHVHLSLQSGDDLILKRMKRRHSAQQAGDFVSRLRAARPDIVIGADFIAGFPTESDGMFENTLRHVDELGVSYLHVFPFSARPGTPAARMPQLNGQLVRERAARLRDFGAMQLDKLFVRERNQLRRVLVEKDGNGRSEHYVHVYLRERHEAGRVVLTRLVESGADYMIGETVA
jgi:threonylcarbamoyladenosine tRNA methylthiotransferase MtaB